MKLIVHELITTLSQDITIGLNHLLCYGIRPHLLKFGNPTGTLTLQLQDAFGKKIQDFETLNISSIPAGNYYHGYIRFQNNVPLKADETYTIALIPGGGYSFSESAYIGWCKDYDLRKAPTAWTPSVGCNAGLDLELWATLMHKRGAA